MTKKNIRELIIIGAGPAGLTAAIYSARARLKPLVFTGLGIGGQLAQTAVVENYPGFPNGIFGTELVNNMKKQAELFGSEFVYQSVKIIDPKDSVFEVTADKKYYSQSIIVATGASPRWLGLENEKKLIGKGISSCATCDGPLYRSKKVAVIGGGDAAMEEALFLSKFALSVTIIHRKDTFRASQIMLEKVKSNNKIKIITNHIVTNYIGADRLEGVIIENVKTRKKEKLEFDGIFLAIGHIANTALLFNLLGNQNEQDLKFENPPLTKIKGLFVAGDVFDSRYRQAITAAGYGCQAAIEAEKYLRLVN